MIIAIGLLIDNAIVMTDEVKKKLDAGAERAHAVKNALSHLFVPLLASTLTTVLGFMPVFLLPGAMGDFVGPIAISVVLALTASFFVSVTIIPALAGLALRRHVSGVERHWWRDGLRNDRMKARYERFLKSALKTATGHGRGNVGAACTGLSACRDAGPAVFPTRRSGPIRDRSMAVV